MQQRKEGTPLSLERAHEIFNGLVKGRDFSYEAEKVSIDSVDAPVEQLDAWALNASIRHEIKLRF